jgi:hypothetical protein
MPRCAAGDADALRRFEGTLVPFEGVDPVVAADEFGDGVDERLRLSWVVGEVVDVGFSGDGVFIVKGYLVIGSRGTIP